MDKRKKRYWFRNISLLLGSFFITLIFLLSLVIPVFNREQFVEPVRDIKNKGIGDWDNETEAFHYWNAPENSFGIQEMKTVNWSFFKQKFTSHTDWVLQYKRYSYSEWTNGDQYLTINRSWNETGFWKINLTFTAPVDVYEARFIFGCDLPVLDYVERDGYEVWVNYSFNATENISLMFNWSDLKSYPGLYFNKGVQNNRFYFLFGKVGIPAGTYVFDPIFGETNQLGTAIGLLDNIVGMSLLSPANGILNNVTVYLAGVGAGEKIKAGVYHNDDLISTSREYDGSELVTSSWNTLDVTDVAIVDGDEYNLTVWNDVDIMYTYWGAGSHSRWTRNYDYTANGGVFPDPMGGSGTASNNVSIYAGYNVSAGEQWNNIDQWNTTLVNGTFTWTGHNINQWNTTLVNLTWNWDKEISNWNTTLVNGTFFWDEHDINLWNTTLVNLTWTWDDHNINLWNTTLVNGTFNWNNISWWNVTLVNSSLAVQWNNINQWNVTLVNGTFTWGNINLWNVTLANLSWNWASHNINLWNITLHNGTWENNIILWNVTLVNSSVDLILISGVYPSNNSFNIPLQPVMYLTINHTLGETMNISWYYGPQGSENILLGTDTNFVNSTQSELNYVASVRSSDYYWRIMVDDGTNYYNYTYGFRTEGYPGGGGGYTPPSSLWAISLFGVLGFVIWMIRRKKNNDDDIYFEE